MRLTCILETGMEVRPSRALEAFCRCEHTCARLTSDILCVWGVGKGLRLEGEADWGAPTRDGGGRGRVRWGARLTFAWASIDGRGLEGCRDAGVGGVLEIWTGPGGPSWLMDRPRELGPRGHKVAHWRRPHDRPALRGGLK